MKKLLFGIFAHPDDEAFGPSGYLYQTAQSGTDVHLITITDGEAGHNEGYENLAEVRMSEWAESCKRIGVKSKHALHYPDGGLSNNLYLEIVRKIRKIIDNVVSKYDEKVEIAFITYEQRGITGHLDHIAVSYMTTYVYEKLNDSTYENIKLDKLRYYCLPKELVRKCNCDWLYMPCGCQADEIDERVSFEEVLEQRIHIMKAHKSQKNDMKEALRRHEISDHSKSRACCTDHFIYYS